MQIDGDNPGPGKLRAMGELCYIYLRSPLHRHARLSDFRALIQPPVDLDQVVIFRDGDQPRASITWAFLSDEAEARFLADEPLRPSDWRSGKNMWVIEMVSLFGDRTGSKAVRWFLDSIPAHVTRLRWQRVDVSSGKRRLVTLTRTAGRWHRVGSE